MPGVTEIALVSELHHRALESVMVEKESEPAVAIDITEELSKVATGSSGFRYEK